MRSRLIESTFLGGIPVPQSRDLMRVLVLGGDGVGNETACSLALAGFEVLLLEELESISIQHMNRHGKRAVLEEIRGFIGGFEAVLKSGDQTFIEKVGFVVAAAPARVVPKYEQYGLVPGKRVISLTEFEHRQAGKEAIDAGGRRWAHVAFLCGLQGETHPAVFSRVLQALDGLADTPNIQTYIFCGNLKVGETDLERRYHESRERGAVYFKFDKPIVVFEQAEEGVTLVFQDPLLHQEMELEPDLLVVDEDLFPPSSLKPLLNAIPSSPAFAPFLQPESLRFPGVSTPRAGFYAVGPARGVYSPELISADIEAVVSAITETSPDLPRDVPEPPLVDESRCVMCLTCVRLCPHGAMGFDRKPVVDPLSCVRCGICAADCPMLAITLPQTTGEEDFDRRLRMELAGQDVSRKIVGFLCTRSAASVFDATSPELKSHMMTVTMPCAGTVGISHILTAFRHGAAGVVLAGCFKGNCASIYGTILADRRIAETEQLLEAAGIAPGKTLFVPCAGNDFYGFASAMHEFVEALNLTDIPIHK